MSSEFRERALRSIRQRLEALERAGLDRAPIKVDPTTLLPRAMGAEGSAQERRVPDRAPAAVVKKPEVAAAVAPPAPPVSSSLFGDDGFVGPAIPVEERRRPLDVLAAEVAGCVRCAELAAGRTQTVFGVGDPGARLMFIGEAPGADEDRLGYPFVGRAGQLLTDMITKGMGLKREDVYIANVIKCRPPGNRDPEPHETANCLAYLEQQAAIIRPAFICLLGKVASQTLLDTTLPMGRLRGKWHRYKGVPTMVTYHPAALLYHPAWKREAWEDLQMLMRAMGLPVPRKKGE